MQWIFIIPIISLAAGSVAIIIFSLRESYRIALADVNEAAEKVRELTNEHIGIYERMYALVFFFGADISADKTEFSVPENAGMQELFDINMQVDLELSLLSEKISQSEIIMKERGATIKKIGEELENFESVFFATVAELNKRIHTARLFVAFKPTRRVFRDIGKCSQRPIVFEKR